MSQKSPRSAAPAKNEQNEYATFETALRKVYLSRTLLSGIGSTPRSECGNSGRQDFLPRFPR
jgi:hypothetical protein